MLTSDKSTLKVESLVVSYGTVNAVNDVSFCLNRGEILSVVGPSGSGKSTILHAIAGLISGDHARISGRVILNDIDISDWPPEKRGIPLLFQNLSLFPHLTVRDNIDFSLKIKKTLDRKQIAEKIEYIARLVHLEPDLMTRYPRELSGGQQQRVGLGRALIGLINDQSPRFLFLDEPLSSVDPHLRDELQNEIDSLKSSLNLGVLYVTHSREEAMRIGDRIAVIDNGQLHQVGTPRQIYEAPTSRFVANFFGISNTFSARISKVNGHNIHIQKNEWPGDLVAHNDNHNEFQIGEKVYFAISPSKLFFEHNKDNSSDENVITGIVEKTAFMGEKWEIRINTSAEPLIVRLGTEYNAPRDGEKINIYWKPKDTIIIK